MLANSVSPPLGGHVLMYRMVPIGGSSVAAHVGVPALAVGARRLLVGMDDHQLGPARLVRRRGMDVQVAEQAAERHVLLGRDLLVAEEDDAVLRQRAVDLVLLAVGQAAARSMPPISAPMIGVSLSTVMVS